MRYRPIDVRLWSDRRFLSLSDQGKLLWIFLLTTPSMLPIPGVIIGGEASLAEQLGWTPELFGDVFQELVQSGLKVRMEGRVVWLSNAMKYQPPRNPNMVKAWAKFWDDIPEGPLKREIWQAIKIACKTWSGLFAKLFPEVFGELFAQLSMDVLHTRTGTGTGTTTLTRTGTTEIHATPETEPEARSKQERKSKLPDDWKPSRSEANLTAERVASERGIDLDAELSNMRDWAAANAAKKVDWDAAWRNWTRNSRVHVGRSNGGGPQLDHLRRMAGEEL